MNADEFPRKFGPYILLKPLARGGMGALYLALSGERSMEKLCVIKTALHHLADKGYLQRFRDEAKVVVRLSHGNLVSVFDAGQIQGELFLAMDFIEGKDLRAVWNRCAQKGIAFPVDVAVHITKELVRGLGYAHSFGGLNLVHRDVSPPNLLLSYSGEVKLTDFGLASSTLKLEKTAPGVIYGKVSYMAPEQARGEGLDGRADLYAAGVMLWELLTGRQLFPASTGLAGLGGEDDLLERVRHPRVAPPSQKTSRVPAELDEIVLRALAAEPGQRYQSGEEFRSALAAFQAKTSPSTDGEHVAAFLRRLFGDEIGKEKRAREALQVSGAALLPKVGTPMAPRPPEPGDDFDAPTPALVRRKGSTEHMDPSRPPGERTPPPSPGASRQPPQRTGETRAIAGPRPTPPPESLSQIVGTVLGGRYRILRLCGEGGMGRVYEAEHVEIGKRVAVKVLHPAYTRTPDVVERFRREARAASRIGHANIVNVTDSGTTDDGSFFFVMEYIEGSELGLLIHKEGPLAVKRALRIADQICQALQAAHDAGVIHRDLKPENVLLVAREGRPDFVKVLDFGIARVAEVEDSTHQAGRRLTRPGVAMGTPEYMAPEQAAGKSADARSDIYAVGSIIYEMLTGTPPYEGDNVMEVLHKKATESPVPLRQVRPDVPVTVEALVDRAMARHADERPQSMAAFAAEIGLVLEAFVGRRTPTEVRPVRKETGFFVGAIEPVTGLSSLGLSRRSTLMAAGALAVVGLLVVVKVATVRPGSPVAAGKSLPTRVVTVPPPVPVVPAVPEAEPAPAAAPEAVPGGPADEWSLATQEQGTAEGEETALAPEDLEVQIAVGDAPRRRRSSTVAARDLLEEGQRMLHAQKYDDAKRAFEKAARTHAVRGRALLGMGQIAFQQQDYEEAVRMAKQGASAGAGVSAHVLLGDAFFKLKDFPSAKKAYSDALKLDPDNKAARSNLESTERRLP
ncbi:MAG: protein kinase [Myxococcales bacterium]|nr:protein kinase [Myxococcales bacterium]